jgi:ribosome-associated translation inhibitor RaiA
MEIGESFRTRIEDHVTGAVRKYFDGGFSSQVIVEKSGSRFQADCKIHLDTGVVLHATGEAQDPQPAFDAAAERDRKTPSPLQTASQGPSCKRSAKPRRTRLCRGRTRAMR